MERAQALLPLPDPASEYRVGSDAVLHGSPLPGIEYTEDILASQNLVGWWLEPVFVAWLRVVAAHGSRPLQA